MSSAFLHDAVGRTLFKDTLTLAGVENLFIIWLGKKRSKTVKQFDRAEDALEKEEICRRVC